MDKDSKKKSEEVFYGEMQCQKSYMPTGSVRPKQCSHKAYFKQSGQYVCGVHSDSSRRKNLAKNPHAKKHKADLLSKHQLSVDTARDKNASSGCPGIVVCSKLRMMKSADNISGYLKIFPNAKHQNRKDGFGCASLSPKCLGPVVHRQKDLPRAVNLENYHQYNKVFPSELTKERVPNKQFYETQRAGYRSKQGHRHKIRSDKGPKEKPVYSIHRDTAGKETHYTYAQSRYLYCHFYELLASRNEDFEKLKKMLKGGTNLQIVGYDGYDVSKALMSHYLDTARPFGHEMCLYTMLAEKDPKDYPWNLYYWGHQDLYPACLSPDSGKEVDTCSKMDEVEVTDDSSEDSD